MIDLHVIKRNKKYIVFHPESLSLFLVSEEIGKTLEFHESESNNPNFAITERDCSKIDIEKLMDYFVDKAKKRTCTDLKWKNRAPKTLCLIVSQDCNLKCSYCYADHGAFGGERKLMSIDTAKNCMDKILDRDFDNHVIFFGGEPFLNFSLMNELDKYVNQTGLEIKYSTVTNGTIMNDDIIKFITEKFYGLCISIDGPKEINDMQRFGGNRSVHDQIIETIGEFKKNSMPFSVKSTITKKKYKQYEGYQ